MKIETYNKLANMLALLHGRIENGAELHEAIEWAQDELASIAGQKDADLQKLLGVPYIDEHGKVQFAEPVDADPPLDDETED